MLKLFLEARISSWLRLRRYICSICTMIRARPITYAQESLRKFLPLDYVHLGGADRDSLRVYQSV